MDAGFCKTSGSWDCPSSLARVSPPQPNDSSSSPPSRPRIFPAPSARLQQRGMTLSDHTTAHNPESNSAVATETEPTTSEPTLTEQQMSEPNTTGSRGTEQHASDTEQASPAAVETPHASASVSSSDDKHAGEDFASALESFTTETEEAVGEDRVIKGTVLKLTSTHVVVDVGR